MNPGASARYTADRMRRLYAYLADKRSGAKRIFRKMRISQFHSLIETARRVYQAFCSNMSHDNRRGLHGGQSTASF